MKKIVNLLVVLVMVFFLSGCSLFSKDVKLQIIEENIATDESKVTEELDVKEGETIILSDKHFDSCEPTPNDIKIVEITKEYVTISRTKTRYDSKKRAYTEEVTENMYFDRKFDNTINESAPSKSFSCAQAKYFYSLMFIKK